MDVRYKTHLPQTVDARIRGMILIYGAAKYRWRRGKSEWSWMACQSCLCSIKRLRRWRRGSPEKGRAQYSIEWISNSITFCLQYAPEIISIFKNFNWNFTPYWNYSRNRIHTYIISYLFYVFWNWIAKGGLPDGDGFGVYGTANPNGGWYRQQKDRRATTFIWIHPLWIIN